MAAKTVKGAAEIAAEYMYHFFDDVLNGEEEEAIERASEIYEMICGEKMNSEVVLGI